MTHKELIVAICKRTGYSKAVVEIIISAYIDIAINEFKMKHSVQLRLFGTLRYINAIMREGYNPIKQKREVFKGKNKIKFIPSKALANILNKPEEN